MELPDRQSRDEDAAAVLAMLSARHRQELIRLLGNPPDLSRVPAAFWKKVRRETNEEAAALLLVMFLASSTFHGAASGIEQQATARIWSAGMANEIVDSYTTTTYNRLTRYAERWTPAITAEELELTSVLGPDRAARLGIDLNTTAQTAGGEWAVVTTVGTSPEDLWKTNPGLSMSGPCPVCEPLDGLPRYIWAAQFPTGPPEPHAGCVCELIYVNLPVPA